MEELRRRAYRRKLFNEQAGKLVSHAPALKDEVAWRVDHLNAKWELVEQIMAPIERPVSNQQDISAGNASPIRLKHSLSIRVTNLEFLSKRFVLQILNTK